MELINHSPFAVACTQGIQPNGRYCLVIAIKATFDLSGAGEIAPVLAQQQLPLQDSDIFLGQPGYSSPLYENDFATEKPKCDVILSNPVAYAPGGEPARQVEVALRIGEIDKRVRVLGRRYWQEHEETLSASEPEPFISQPLSWEIAYGGVDEGAYEEPQLSDAYLPNPVGIGYRKHPDRNDLAGTPIAQTEALDSPITSPEQQPEPQGFGPIARNWHPRSGYGGTYDAAWLRARKPFLPDDFDPRYYQCAPEDQQMDYPRGGENVQLVNLSSEGMLSFTLPRLDVPLTVIPRAGGVQRPQVLVDTLSIDAEHRRLTLVARAQAEFLHSLHEIASIQVGQAPEAEREDEIAEAHEAPADA